MDTAYTFVVILLALLFVAAFYTDLSRRGLLQRNRASSTGVAPMK